MVTSLCFGQIYEESRKPLTYICSASAGPVAFVEVDVLSCDFSIYVEMVVSAETVHVAGGFR